MSAAVSSSRYSRFLRAGPIMMVLGALLTVGGIVGTTASTNGGNQSCPSGTVLISKFNYDHGYVFEKPSGNEHVVTLSHASAEGATWHSTLPVSYVIVKGGPNSVLYTISPAKYDGTFSNQGLPTVGEHHNHPDISNVQFCGVISVVTSTSASTSTSSTSSTSTSSTSTSTSSPTSTTCGECQTTTTHAPVTTTCGQCQTTTTHAPVTTTCGQCQTTTTHAPVTTTCECTTTTMHHTTTTVGETTSTGAGTTVPDGSTTSSSQVAGTTILGETTTTQGNHHVTTTTGKSGAQGGTTTFKPYVTSTSILTPNNGNELPFTGSGSMPLVALGIVLLATGLTLTLSQARRRTRSGA